MEYLAQYPAGTTTVVIEGLRDSVRGFVALRTDDSALLFASADRIDSADAIPFVKNLFRVCGRATRRTVDGTVTDLAGRLGDVRRPGGSTAFRVMCHFDGRLVACSAPARQRLERAVSAVTGLRTSPRGRCQEYWVIGRRGWSVAFLGERLPTEARRSAVKGSLSPELSALLVTLSNPDPRDVFIDPFAGSGSLVAARLDRPARTVIYNDLDDSLRTAAMNRIGRHEGVLALQEDGTRLPSVASGSVSAIVTDPPWGEHDNTVGDYGRFARSYAATFVRVLHPRAGRLVLLVNRRNEAGMRTALRDRGFAVEPPVEILVNGHPSSVIRATPQDAGRRRADPRRAG